MVEVEWNEGQHFGTVRKKLDNFSTFGGLAAPARFGAGGSRSRFDQGEGRSSARPRGQRALWMESGAAQIVLGDTAASSMGSKAGSDRVPITLLLRLCSAGWAYEIEREIGTRHCTLCIVPSATILVSFDQIGQRVTASVSWGETWRSAGAARSPGSQNRDPGQPDYLYPGSFGWSFSKPVACW